MQLKLNSYMDTPIGAEADVVINMPQKLVFDFIAGNFHNNYQKWMPDVVELEFIDGIPVEKGGKVRQVKLENNQRIPSIFEVMECSPYDLFAFEGKDVPYRQIYKINALGPEETKLVFRFELLEIDFFMRPFVKLIRVAVTEGVECTVKTLADLLLDQQTLKPVIETTGG